MAVSYEDTAPDDLQISAMSPIPRDNDKILGKNCENIQDIEHAVKVLQSLSESPDDPVATLHVLMVTNRLCDDNNDDNQRKFANGSEPDGLDKVISLLRRNFELWTQCKNESNRCRMDIIVEALHLLASLVNRVGNARIKLIEKNFIDLLVHIVNSEIVLKCRLIAGHCCWAIAGLILK